MKQLITLVIAFVSFYAAADVKLPPVISSHMVLQREMPVPIWGTAAPGEKVTVKFRDQQQTATADDKGKWMVKLTPLTTGGPDVMTVVGKNELKLEDVLVGEVWVGSGQSNMDMGVSSYVKGDEVLAKLGAGTYPKLRLIRAGNASWNQATPENIQKHSALLFSFGLPLQKALDVPVGIMVGAVGGTPSGYWLSEETLAADAAVKLVIDQAKSTYNEEAAKKKYEADLAAWTKADAEAKAKGAKSPRKPDLPLKPGDCRGKVGNLYESKIRPFQPYAIRGVLWDQGESGTAIQNLDQYTLMGALIRGWRKEWNQGDFPWIYIQKPSGGGCAWDYADPITNKAEKFTALPAQVPATNTGAYRENHVKIMSYPKTAMAIATDLGQGIHPSNKSGYGERACRVALGFVYGKPVEYYGPVYASHEAEGNKVRVKFTHVGQGLAFKNGDKLQGFAIAGEDKKFYWADATIDGETVVLACKDVAKPVAVRYAWSQSHPWANLFNKDGLPAISFRTDSW